MYYKVPQQAMKPRQGVRAWMASKLKEEPKSARKIVSEFCSYTTLTGLGRIVDSTTVTRRAFWILLCLGAYAMCSYHLHALFVQYFEKPTVTVLTVKHAPRMTFPSVTVCNLNMIRKSKLPHYIKKHLKELEQQNQDLDSSGMSELTDATPLNIAVTPPEQTDTTTEPTSSLSGTSSTVISPTNATRRRKRDNQGTSNTATEAFSSSGNSDVSDSSNNFDGGDDVADPTDWVGSGDGDDYFTEYEDKCDPDDPYSDEYCEDSELLGEEDQLQTIETAILYELSIRNEKELMAAGHQFTDLVRKCTFQGYNCRNMSRFWTMHWDYRYGNCFTFNPGRDQSGNPRHILRTYKTGIKSGLKLNLFIEQSEYVPDLSEAAGAKILFSPQGHVPFPEDEGFFVMPGRLTAFGLRKSLILRADPFGNGSCKEDKSLSNDNIYKKRFNAKYTIQACTKHCLAEQQVKVCKCAEMKFQVPNTTVCDVTDKLSMKCVQAVKRQYIEGKLGCEKRCPNPCRETIIKSTSSISQWPSNSYEEKLVLDHQFQEFNINNSKYAEAVYMSRTNLLQVRVYFEQLNYEQVTEKLSYTWENLAADIGGETGLWIGFRF